MIDPVQIEKLMARYVKVRIVGRRSIYLELPRVISMPKLSRTAMFLVGGEVNRQCESVLARTDKGMAERRHMIQLMGCVSVIPQACNRTYCTLESYTPEDATKYWSYPEDSNG